MSAFDSKAFAQTILAEGRSLLGDTLDAVPELRARFAAFQADVEVTLAALEIERDSLRADSIREDLEHFLPARKAAIVSAARSHASADLMAALETALAIAVRAAVIVARAFVTSPRGLS